jgi:hypothetical protein
MPAEAFDKTEEQVFDTVANTTGTRHNNCDTG